MPGGGGDYTSLQAAESGERTDLQAADKIMVFECYSGGNCSTGASVIFSGWNGDSTRYIIVRAASGEGHEGVFTTDKAYFQSSTQGLIQSELRVEVKRMQVKSTSVTASNAPYEMNFTVAQECLLEECLLIGGGTCFIAENSSSFKFGRLDSCVLLNAGTRVIDMVIPDAGASYLELNNCTIIDSGATPDAIRALSPGLIKTENCYIHGTISSRVTLSNTCATMSDAAPTTDLRNIAYDTATFLAVAGGSENLHLGESSPLLDQGVVLGVALTDFEGGTRVSPWDIGADDAAVGPDEGAAGSSLPTLRPPVYRFMLPHRASRGFF
jgi:hypothetical protein